MLETTYLTGWHLIEVVVTFAAFLGILWHLYKNHERIWSGTKRATRKGVGLIALFSGSIVLGSVGLAIWNFSRFLSFTSVSSLAGSCLGAGIGAAAFAGVGMYAVLGGIWLTVPDTRLGRFVKRRFFGRPSPERRKGMAVWAGVMKRIPAAGILRFLSGL